MKRKKRILITLISVIMSMSLFCVTHAEASGGVVAKEDGQTDIMAGVAVDYMRKLKFIVMERNTLVPISGASIEIYVPSLDRFVLFGVTDAEGIYELAVTYGNSGATSDNQFATINGKSTFQGDSLNLNSDNLRFRAYKSSWLPYPHTETVVLDNKQNPQVIKVYLHKDKDKGDPSDPDPVDPTKPTTPDPPKGPGSSSHKDNLIDTIVSIINGDVPLGEYLTSGGIPKTGVEGAIPYWIMGLIAFLLAGVILLFVIKKDGYKSELERRK